MGVVGRVDYGVLAEPPDGVGKAGVGALDADEHAPARHQVRGVGRPAPLLARHAVHHIGQPDGVGLEVGDAQIRELVEHAVEEHAGELDHHGDGVLQDVGVGYAAVEVEAEPERRGAVHGERDAQPLRLVVERPERLVAEGAPHAHIGAVGGEHSADHAQFLDAAAQLARCGVNVLQRQQRDSGEAGVHPAVGGGEPVVVALADGDRPLGVLDHSDAESGGGVEDGAVDADVVEEAAPGDGVYDALPPLLRARLRAGRAALEAVERGEEGVVERDFGVAVGRVQMPPYLDVALADVPVAVYRPKPRADHNARPSLAVRSLSAGSIALGGRRAQI